MGVRMNAEILRLRAENAQLREDLQQFRELCDQARPFMAVEKSAPTRELDRKLKEACDVFRSAKSDKDPAHVKREAIAMSLSAVLDYLDFRTSLGACEPLRVIFGELADADDGRTPKLFRSQDRKRGRPRSSLAEDCVLAEAAAAVTLLIRSGVTEGEGSRRVANLLPARDAGQLQRWRDKLPEKRKEVRNLYYRLLSYQDIIVNDAAKECGLTPEDIDEASTASAAADFLMQNLSRRLRG